MATTDKIIQDGDIITIGGVSFRIDYEDIPGQKYTTYSVSYGAGYCLALTLTEGMTINQARALIMDELKIKEVA